MFVLRRLRGPWFVTHELCDFLRCLIRIVVFPYPYDLPARCRQPAAGIDVTIPIALDLVRPVPVVCPMRPSPMVWTAVPEASIDKDGDLGPREHNVRRSTKRRFGAAVDQIAKAPRM